MPASAWNRPNNTMQSKMTDARPAKAPAASAKPAGRSALPAQPKAPLKPAKRRKKASSAPSKAGGKGFVGEKAPATYMSAGQNRAIQTRAAAKQQLQNIPARNDRKNIVWGD